MDLYNGELTGGINGKNHSPFEEIRTPLFEIPPLSGERHATWIKSSGGSSTGVKESFQSIPAINNPIKSLPLARTICIRHAIRFALEAIEIAIENNDDPVVKGNAVYKLRETFSLLWNERDKRENQFGDLVNLLQGVLLGIEVEDVPLSHLAAIASVMNNIESLAKLTNADLRDAHRILTRAGCDVFRTLR